MPELPEVETTRRGIEPWIKGQEVTGFHLWQPELRWPVPADLATGIRGQKITNVRRRGKYLLLDTGEYSLIMHLGMSGSLRICQPQAERRKHDHWQLDLGNGHCLRYHDPRRFGALLSAPQRDLDTHFLLRSLGIEPLDEAFNGDYLFWRARGRKMAVKTFIMNASILVGVGNIYASEALFLAGIHPARAAGRISQTRFQALARSIKQVLEEALRSGGTTLRDYVNGNGEPGYFRLHLRVYGRAGEPCLQCAKPVRAKLLGQRSSFYCAGCQR